MIPLSDSPLDDFVFEMALAKFAAAKKTKEELRQLKQKEVELWHNWNTSGRKPEDLLPLKDSLKPAIEYHAKKWRNRVELPTSVIDAEYNKHFVKAMETYNPNKGSGLTTYLDFYLKKANRYFQTYQNVGKMSEGTIKDITAFKGAREHLTDKFGHEPDANSLAEHLGWTTRRVARVQKSIRADIPASQWGSESDPADFLHPKELEAIKLMQYELAPEERTVWEHTYGMNGKPMLQPGQIAKATGLSGPKVSRIRAKLRTKFNEMQELVG